jgi:hypothetical protein
MATETGSASGRSPQVRDAEPTVRWSVAVLAISGIVSCTKHVSPGALPPTPVLGPPAAVYSSTVTASIIGHLEISGQAYGQPFGTPTNTAVDADGNITDGRSGDEPARSCGSRWTQSQARASASLTVQNDVVRRAFGFGAAVDAFAKGGFWRGKVLLVCKGSNNTVASANATAGGTINLSFNANPDVTDQLIIRTEGTTRAQMGLRVTDGAGADIPLHDLPNGIGTTVELVKPGPYTVLASVATSARNGGGGNAFDEHPARMSISVQSLRDAINLGYGTPAGPKYLVPLSVGIALGDLLQLIRDSLFTDHGRFYPCAKPNACKDKKSSGIYLSNPGVGAGGSGAMVVEADVGGSYWAVVLPFKISGHILMSATPVVERNILRLAGVALDLSSRNFLVQTFSGEIAQRIYEKTGAKRFDLQPKINAAIAKVAAKFPLRWGPACLLLDVPQLEVLGVYTDAATAQLIVMFGLGIKTESGAACVGAR